MGTFQIITMKEIKLLSTRDLADLMETSTSDLNSRLYKNEKTLPKRLKIGNWNYFPIDDVEQFLKIHKKRAEWELERWTRALDKLRDLK